MHWSPSSASAAATGSAPVEATVDEALRRVLAASPGQRICVLGVGNRSRSDDGAGSVLAERLAARVEAAVIDGGAVPENHLEKAARTRPDTVLIVDAIDLGRAPGTWRVLSPDALAPSALSSHALSIGMAAEYLRARSGARIAVLGIQPRTVAPGNVLSDVVANALERLVEQLAAVISEQTRDGE